MPIWPTWLASKDGDPSPSPSPVAEVAKPPRTLGDLRLADIAAGGTGTMDTPVPKQVIEAAIARAEAARRPSSVPAAPATPWAAAAPSTPPVPVPPPQRLSYPDLSQAIRAPEPPPPARALSSVDLSQATERGVAAASNAAAGTPRAAPAERADGAQPAAQPAAPAREPPREHVDLLWFDAASVQRILADKVLGEARSERPGPRWMKEAAPSREPPEAKDRREILAVISRGKPVAEPAAIDQVASAAYRDDGTFAAPLILVAGELSFDFDEVETLRALLTVVTPFLASDKKLRETAGSAGEALKAEGRLPADIASGLTRRVTEAFAAGQHAVVPGYLDTSVERILLEGRRYAKKTLFGEPRLRALLAFPGGSAPVPTYLPEALATRLPLFRRFKARAVVELRPQEDQYETHADALLVLALARVLRRGG